RVGLPITVGIARTKFLAKVASGVAKPDGLLVVPPERELAFLHPLPVERLWGVGRVTAAKLHARGIRTVGEVARLAESELVSLLGRASGRQLHALAHNRGPRTVRPNGRCGRQPRRRPRGAARTALRSAQQRRPRRGGRRGAPTLRCAGDHAGRAARSRPRPRDAGAARRLKYERTFALI